MTFLKRGLRRMQQAVTDLLIEVPARLSGIDRLIDGLERTGQTIEKRVAKAQARPQNNQALAHIIGIERWGQSRIRVALGEPLQVDESDEYCPAEQDWQDLSRQFRHTRQETISLSKSLRMARVDPGTRILHNQLGEISLLGWLFYLNLHADLESKRING